MIRNVACLLLFVIGAALPSAAQTVDSRKRVAGVFLGAPRVGERRQFVIDVHKGLLISLLDNLVESGDEYLVFVRIGDETYAGRFFEPLPARRVRHTPKNWSPNSPVQVRFKKGGKTKVRMYVRGPTGKTMPTELFSIIGPDGSERCRGGWEQRNCLAGWRNP